MNKSYSGPLGTFEYDDELWNIKHDQEGAYLSWVGAEVEVCEIPLGIKSCRKMFFSATEDLLSFRGFNMPDDIEDMESMFAQATIPEDFSWTGFKSSNVKNFSQFFCYARIKFSGRLRIDVSNARDLSYFFCDAEILNSISFKYGFKTEKCRDLSGLLVKAKVMDELSFGNGFIINPMAETRKMFYMSKLKGTINLGKDFDVSSLYSEEDVIDSCYSIKDYLNSSLIVPTKLEAIASDQSDFF